MAPPPSSGANKRLRASRGTAKPKSARTWRIAPMTRFQARHELPQQRVAAVHERFIKNTPCAAADAIKRQCPRHERERLLAETCLPPRGQRLRDAREWEGRGHVHGLTLGSSKSCPERFGRRGQLVACGEFTRLRGARPAHVRQRGSGSSFGARTRNRSRSRPSRSRQNSGDRLEIPPVSRPIAADHNPSPRAASPPIAMKAIRIAACGNCDRPNFSTTNHGC